MENPLIWLVLIAYILGSIPFSLLIGRFFAKTDIRKAGSHNVGATNLTRLAGAKLGFLGFILDFLKGVAAVWIAATLIEGNLAKSLAAFAAVIGHMYPIWLRFKGGKGVATYFGVLVTLGWMIALPTMLVWVGAFYKTRYSSIASISSMVAACIFAIITPFFAVCCVIGALVIWKHKGNIQRLLNGTEGAFKK